MKNQREKKAELTTQQIVFIIILIMSFAIILFFILRINFQEVGKKEVCHNSVALFQSTKVGGKISTGNLNCQINYLCLSSSGKCSDFSPDTTINVKTKSEIFKSLADEMTDCWWMFGEGKVDYLEESDYDSQCAICSIVKFDSSTSEISTEKINAEEFYTFLKTEKKSDRQTYLEYLYGVDDMSKFKSAYYKNDFIDLNEKYVVMTGQNDEIINVLPFVDKGNRIYASLVPLNNLSESKLCENYDLTKA